MLQFDDILLSVLFLNFGSRITSLSRESRTSAKKTNTMESNEAFSELVLCEGKAGRTPPSDLQDSFVEN